jgi:hypothetical protein
MRRRSHGDCPAGRRLLWRLLLGRLLRPGCGAAGRAGAAPPAHGGRRRCCAAGEAGAGADAGQPGRARAPACRGSTCCPGLSAGATGRRGDTHAGLVLRESRTPTAVARSQRAIPPSGSRRPHQGPALRGVLPAAQDASPVLGPAAAAYLASYPAWRQSRARLQRHAVRQAYLDVLLRDRSRACRRDLALKEHRHCRRLRAADSSPRARCARSSGSPGLSVASEVAAQRARWVPASQPAVLLARYVVSSNSTAPLPHSLTNSTAINHLLLARFVPLPLTHSRPRRHRRSQRGLAAGARDKAARCHGSPARRRRRQAVGPKRTTPRRAHAPGPWRRPPGSSCVAAPPGGLRARSRKQGDATSSTSLRRRSRRSLSSLSRWWAAARGAAGSAAARLRRRGGKAARSRGARAAAARPRGRAEAARPCGGRAAAVAVAAWAGKAGRS